MNKAEFFTLCEHLFALNSISRFATRDNCDRLFDAMTLILDKSRVMNLTSICSEEEFGARHFADALIAEKYISKGASVLDVGTGGGILAITYAIVRPDIKVTAIDSTAKKTAFVEECAKSLNLPNLTAFPARAEEFSRTEKGREAFDFVCARAVASLPVLCELCLPLTRLGGRFCALKGKAAPEELASSGNAIKKLGGTLLCDDYQVLTEISEGADVLNDRHIIVIEKSSKTSDNYPRAFARITKNPL